MKRFFRLPAIIGALPVTLTNGTTADATQVMSDLSWIVNQTNANAAPLATTALINANNNFSVVQSGIAATAAAHFPIASQVQNQVFNTLSSTLGTNTLTARIAALPLAAYAVGQVFTFIPSQSNTQSATMNIDGLGSGVIRAQGRQLSSSQLIAGVTASLCVNAIAPMPVFDLLTPANSFVQNSLTADRSGGSSVFIDGPALAIRDGRWFVTSTITMVSGLGTLEYKLWDGSTVIDSCQNDNNTASSASLAVTLSGFILGPTSDVRVSVSTSAASLMVASTPATSIPRACTIAGLRIFQ